MICIHCGRKQETGKFCGGCGNKIGESGEQSTASAEQAVTVETPVSNAPNSMSAETTQATQAAQATQVAEPNVHLENVKEKSKVYWSYFMEYLKRPGKIFDNPEKEFLNGFISIAIFSILVGMVQYSALNGLTRDAFGGFGGFAMDQAGVSFIGVFTSGVISTFIGIGLVTLVLFIVSKLFGSEFTFKGIISIYGAHIGTVLIANVAAFLLVLISSYYLGSMLIGISLLWTIIVVPIYLVISMINRQPKNVDPYYAFGIYIVLTIFVFFLYAGVIVATTLNKFMDLL